MANEVLLNKQDFDKKIKLFYQHWDKVSQSTHFQHYSEAKASSSSILV
jgi:hypothetical protein